jgi:hypothetical protein
MTSAIRFVLLTVLVLAVASCAWAQWSSDPSKNLPLSDIHAADQVQPKVLALPDDNWYVSWFNNNPNDPPPNGYDVYYQLLSPNGVEQFPHDGVQVAKLTLSSTEDYGLDADASGNALLAFLDDRKDPNNPQVTAAKMNSSGMPLWGPSGVVLTFDPGFHAAPKIAATTDGDVVVAWTTDDHIVVQRLDPNGRPLWVGENALAGGIIINEPNFNYALADMHASDNGSVIISWVRSQGFSGNKELYADKISADHQFLWGPGHVKVFDGGSLQFGEFPYFLSDGSGGAVFAWYSSSPALQCFAQHILSDGSEAFPHNGSQASTDLVNVRVSPAVSYRPSTQETFLFWTEEDSLQVFNGIYAQKFDPAGASQWGGTGLVIVPLGTDSQIFAQTVQIGTGALAFWFDQPSFGSGTIQAVKLDASGTFVCPQFPVSTASADKSRLFAGIASSGLAALAWQDDRNGENDIFIQNVNPDCSLGQQGRHRLHRHRR